MDRVRLADVDNAYGPAAVSRRLTGPLGAADVALNYGELDPGDAFGFGYHRHAAHEEVFVVEAGTGTFETEAGPVVVGPNEAVRFAPGEYQRGVNEGNERVRALAIGAPRESGETEVRRRCADCGERTPQTIEWADDAEGLVSRCLDCGAVTGRFVHGDADRGEA